MSCIRPATPGFLITLCATIILAVVVFCVPYVKSVYFLKAGITYGGVSGNITFGTLGYCVELAENTTCSTPSIGYELDINSLVGDSLPVQIPQVVVKWITYLLFLHVVALIAAAGSAAFGLLAHVREASMACCSTCFSGFAAVVTLIAFIFDLVLFFVAKARINSIGYAQIGNAIWLTLAAWILLFFSGCFYTLGRCCIRNRPGFNDSGSGGVGGWLGRRNAGGPDNNYAEQMRLDAVKAEADRKARQAQGEVGLPAFYETQPLTGNVEGDHVYVDGASNQSKSDLAPSRQQSTNFKGGYAPGLTGTRSVDDYYHNGGASAGYPPPQGLRRQQSEYSTTSAPPSTSPPIGYAKPSGYVQYNPPQSTSPPPISNNQLLVPPGQHQPFSNTPDPYGREYGHAAGGTSYHTAISHDQGLSSYGQPYEPLHDPYAAYQPHHTQQHLAQSAYHPDPYMPSFVSHTPIPLTLSADAYRPPINTSPPPIHQPQPLHGERSYTLGGDGYGTSGDGYGANRLPPLPERAPTLPAGAGSPPYVAYGQQQHQQPPSIDTNIGAGYATGKSLHLSPVNEPVPNEAPPGYEPSAPGGVVGNWGKR